MEYGGKIRKPKGDCFLSFTQMQHLDQLTKLPLDSVKMEPCYTKVTRLPEGLLDLQSRFRFPHVDLVVQRTQNYMQEVRAEGCPGRGRKRRERQEERVRPGEQHVGRCGRAALQLRELRPVSKIRLSEDTHRTSSWLYLSSENKYLGNKVALAGY